MSASGRTERVFLLGIDGVPHSLLKQFAAGGVMPRLGELMADDNTARIDSVLPTVSNVAWASFQTGKNPGKFDIFGFTELRPDMHIRLPNAKDLRSETVQELASRAGRYVVSLGLPCSYPPRAVNGLLVGGFLAPSVNKAVYPITRLGEIQRLGYELDVDPVKARQDPAFFKRQLMEVFAARRRAAEALLRSEPWDLFLMHVMETDRLNHFLWRQWETGEGEDKTFFEEFYRQLDDFIWRVAESLAGRGTLIVMSDHGFCSIRREVQLNRWLVREGYLEVGGDPASQMFAAVSDGSRAFAMVPGRVHLMRDGAYDRGRVKQDEAGALRDEIMGKLRDWADPDAGQTICNEVLGREQVYTGPFVEHGPDIVADPRNGYDLKAALTDGELFTSSAITGMHTRDDAFLLIVGRRLTGQRRCLTDVTRTVLDILGVQSPDDLDSRGVLA